MRPRTGLDGLYAEAARVTAEGSKSFHFATRFFPAELARSAHAVYWFCRHTDDLADEAPDPRTGWRDVEEWSEATRRALNTGSATHPALRLFAETVEKHRIPHEYPLELIEGMRMDLRGQRYRTFSELRLFCYRVASVVGLMMAHVIGFREPAPRYAVHLGIAMQLTNILRDVGEDLRRNRIYLPSDEMAAFGYSEEALRRSERGDRFRELMEFQISRARDFYAAAEPGIDLLSDDGRFAVQVSSRVYRGILREIERAEYNVFERRAVVPGYKKSWIALTSMAFPAARHSFGRLAFWRP